MDFGTRRCTFIDTTGAITNMVDINANVSTVKAGFNYRWGGPVVGQAGS
jgi:hypothetical protein